jgi:hypothetical protein
MVRNVEINLLEIMDLDATEFYLGSGQSEQLNKWREMGRRYSVDAIQQWRIPHHKRGGAGQQRNLWRFRVVVQFGKVLVF